MVSLRTLLQCKQDLLGLTPQIDQRRYDQYKNSFRSILDITGSIGLSTKTYVIQELLKTAEKLNNLEISQPRFRVTEKRITFWVKKAFDFPCLLTEQEHKFKELLRTFANNDDSNDRKKRFLEFSQYMKDTGKNILNELIQTLDEKIEKKADDLAKSQDLANQPIVHTLEEFTIFLTNENLQQFNVSPLKIKIEDKYRVVCNGVKHVLSEIKEGHLGSEVQESLESMDPSLITAESLLKYGITYALGNVSNHAIIRKISEPMEEKIEQLFRSIQNLTAKESRDLVSIVLNEENATDEFEKKFLEALNDYRVSFQFTLENGNHEVDCIGRRLIENYPSETLSSKNKQIKIATDKFYKFSNDIFQENKNSSKIATDMLSCVMHIIMNGGYHNALSLMHSCSHPIYLNSITSFLSNWQANFERDLFFDLLTSVNHEGSFVVGAAILKLTFEQKQNLFEKLFENMEYKLLVSLAQGHEFGYCGVEEATRNLFKHHCDNLISMNDTFESLHKKYVKIIEDDVRQSFDNFCKIYEKLSELKTTMKNAVEQIIQNTTLEPSDACEQIEQLIKRSDQDFCHALNIESTFEFNLDMDILIKFAWETVPEDHPIQDYSAEEF